MKKNIVRNKKRFAKVMVFIIMLSVVCYGIRSALSFKYGDGILGIRCFYEQEKDSIDVLALGSSHAFEDINTGILFDSYGMSAYVLAGSVQPYWNTYYYLCEALKTQHPKLILLEAYCSTFESDYSDHSRIIKNNLGIKDPAARYESLQISAPDETRSDYLLDYRLWHSRYTELGESDFSDYYDRPLYEYYKGFGINFGVTACDRPDADAFAGTEKLNSKTEQYYRKIIELSIQEDIPLLVVVSPYIVSEKEQKQFHESQRIADEYGVPFINFNSSYYYDMMGLDFSADFADTSHLNYIGNEKYTRVLADTIKQMYEIPDHRNDPEYISWQQHSRDILGRTENGKLRQVTDWKTYLGLLQKENYKVVVVPTGQSSLLFKDEKDLLAGWGIAADTFADGNLYVLDKGKLVYQDTDIRWDYKEKWDDDLFKIDKSAETKDGAFTVAYRAVWDGAEKAFDANGCYIVVYDDFSEELVQICRFYVDGENNIQKEGL